MGRGAWGAPIHTVHGVTKNHRVKNLPTMQETPSLIPGSGKSPGEGNGNPFQYPCLEKPMGRGAWGAPIHTVAHKDWATNTFPFHDSAAGGIVQPLIWELRSHAAHCVVKKMKDKNVSKEKLLGFPGAASGEEPTYLSVKKTDNTGVWFLGREDPLEKRRVTHSSVPAWRIPWMEEPGGLQSTGSQRVGHDWSTWHARTRCILKYSSRRINHSKIKQLKVIKEKWFNFCKTRSPGSSVYHKFFWSLAEFFLNCCLT